MRILVLIVGMALSGSTLAVDMASVVQAQVILGQIDQVIDKYEKVQALLDAGTLELETKEPIEGSGGKFLLPFDAEGAPTPWAEKALTAKAGATAGAAVGQQGAQMLASKVPLAGGLIGGFAKKKAKETGAVMAIGGWDFIKENTTHSFNNMADYSVYLHSKFAGTPGYQDALAAAMAIYPDLEGRHKAYVDKAYKQARKKARKAKLI